MTTAPKLTPAQLRVLRELCKPGAKAHYIGGINARWFLSPSMTSATRQVMALIKNGLLKEEGAYPRNLTAYATPAAHALLASLDAEG